MRIIAKEADFYDYGMSYGIDPNVVYVREPREVDARDIHKSHSKSQYVVRHGGKRYDKGDRVDIDEVIFVVAGKVRRLYYKNSDVADDLDVTDDPAKWGSVYPSSIRQQESDQKLIDLATTLKAPVMVCGVSLEFVRRYVTVQTTFHGLRYKGSERVETGAVATVEVGSNTTYINAPILGSLRYNDFFGVTPEQTFMEIQNWLMSVGDKPMAEIGNKEKIIKAGFDTKTSFRGK